jgi:hypothetical protein
MTDGTRAHTEERPAQVISRVLRRTGLGFPRGMLGDDVAVLAAALAGPGPNPSELDDLVTVATIALWDDLQPPTLAAVEMHLARAEGRDRDDLVRVLGWAEETDAANPLARAMTVRAAQELGAAVAHAEQHLRAADPVVAQGGRPGALAAVRALSGAVIALLDLDPEDFAGEIVDYIDRDQDADALDELARATGDLETRAWARDVVVALSVSDAPSATGAVQQLAAGDVPSDPAEDAVWVPTILALANEGVERALAQEAEGGR